MLAIGIFLLTVAFVFSFVPVVLAPFTDDPADAAVSDRIADDFVDALAAGSTTPSRLNETCTVAFFTRSDSTDCPTDLAAELSDQAGVANRYRMNVSLEEPRRDAPGLEPLCTNGSVVESCGTGGERLSVGEERPRVGETVVVSRRTVVVEDRTAVLVVRVWT